MFFEPLWPSLFFIETEDMKFTSDYSLRIIRLPDLLGKFLTQIENCSSLLLHAHNFILPTAGIARLATKYTKINLHAPPPPLRQHPRD